MPRRILLLDHHERTLDPFRRVLEEAVGEGARVEVVTSERAVLARVRDREPWDLVIIDSQLGDGRRPGLEILSRLRAADPELPVVVVAEAGDVASVQAAVEAGANDFLVRGDHLPARIGIMLGKVSRVGRLLVDHRSLKLHTRQLQAAEDARYRLVVGSPQMEGVLRQVRRVARVPRPVLIRGERGTGKELVARAIHREATEEGRPFVAVNCAALADTLLESELFGHVKGAFTGAVTARRGKFDQAAQGTLFLDEVGNMSSAFQQKILRVVEYGTFNRVGGAEEIRVQTRIVAATNADLEARMESGAFLRDLYDRLAFEEIQVPALRERAGEVEVLAQHFLETFMQEVPAFRGKRLSREALDRLHRYRFPGNVRELKNIIERAVTRDTTNELTPEDLGLLQTGQGSLAEGSFKERVWAFEHQLLIDALADAAGNQTRAAESLAMPYHQFRHYCRKHGLRSARRPTAGPGAAR